MSVSAIPWSSINSYATRYGYVGEKFDRLVRLVRSVDDAWLKLNAVKDTP